MTPLFKKLQLPATLDEILVLLVFVKEKKQIENRIETVYPKLVGDAVLWFAYPKKTSKKYDTEITK